FELVVRAVTRLWTGAGEPRVTPLVVGVIALSSVVSYLISHYEHRRGRELRSELLIADAAHTRSDVYASLAVLAGLALIALGYPAADAAVTLVVAGVIGRAGWRILRNTVPVLVDERAVDPGTIRRIAQGVPGV